MRNLRNTAWLLVSVAVSCMLVLIVLRVLSLRLGDAYWVETQVAQLGGPSALLDAADDLRSRYMNDRSTIVLTDEARENWPATFRRPDVVELQIRSDCVLVYFGMRRHILLFRSEVPQYGTKRIADRVWYWGGERSAVGW